MLLIDLFIIDSHDAQGESLSCPRWWEEISGERDWKCAWGVPVLYPSARGVLLVFSRRILCFEDSPNAQTCKHMKLFLEVNVPI